VDFVKRVAVQAVAHAARSRQKRITRSLLSAVLADQVNLESQSFFFVFLFTHLERKQMPNEEVTKGEDHQDDASK
jgi:hypothetical protein